LFLAAASLPAQLVTTFASNNGGSIGGAVYFTLTCTDPTGVTITDLDLNFSAASTVGDIEVWLKCGDSTPHTSAAWTLVDGAFGVAALGQDVPSPAHLASGVQLSPFCSYGVALVALGSLAHRYTTGTGFQLNYTAPGLALDAGQASNAPFAGPVFDPRVVNANIHYVPGGTGSLDCGCVAPQGPGCGIPGTPPLGLVPVNRPVQGPAGPITVAAMTIDIPTTALMHLGIVGLTRPGFPLAGIGMPGCFANTSLDIVMATVAFAAPSHTWVVATIPPAPALSGVQFNAQAAIFGTPANNFLGLGALTSNGLKYTIGTL
jgi:hypothetical protein